MGISVSKNSGGRLMSPNVFVRSELSKRSWRLNVSRSPKRNKWVQKKPEGSKWPENEEYTCDGCMQGIADMETFWGCQPCDISVCECCYFQKSKENKQKLTTSITTKEKNANMVRSG